MAIEITVPRLGWSMEEGTFAEWLKRDGEFVHKGDLLFVLEGDKAAQDVESFDEGILRIPADAPQPGDVVRVGQILGFLAADGEPAPSSVVMAAATPAASPAVVEVAARVAPAVASESRRTEASSPRARRKARELGIDWTHVSGTGRGGRVRERDVLLAAQGAAGPSGEGGITWQGLAGKVVPLSATRRTIARNMRQSLEETAPVTLTTVADASNLVSLREQFRTVSADGQLPPSYTDILVKLAATLLEQHPALNAQWHDGGLFFPAETNIGIAVDTPEGLLVPVVRNVRRFSLKQLAARTRELVEAARARTLPPDQMRGGTFTVTSLGHLGIDAFTPIIHWPQSAILGIGRIRKEPAVVDDRIVVRHQLTLSLTFDHRIADGAPAARFLDALRTATENPAAHLVG